jgi:hypothetical protein
MTVALALAAIAMIVTTAISDAYRRIEGFRVLLGADMAVVTALWITQRSFDAGPIRRSVFVPGILSV